MEMLPRLTAWRVVFLLAATQHFNNLQLSGSRHTFSTALITLGSVVKSQS